MNKHPVEAGIENIHTQVNSEQTSCIENTHTHRFTVNKHLVETRMKPHRFTVNKHPVEAGIENTQIYSEQTPCGCQDRKHTDLQ